MDRPTGLLTPEQLKDLVDAGRIDTVLVVFTDLYGRFMGKRLDAGYFLDAAADGGTGACDYLLTVDMEMEPVPGYAFANWESGYGDVHLTPDMSTLRVATWLDRTAMVICDVHRGSAHEPVAQAPRWMLRRQIERAAQMGFDVMAGSEIEYYIFRDSYRDAVGKAHRDLEPAGWYREDYHIFQGTRVENLNGAARRHLRDSGIGVECTKGEWGLGQHELNLHYSDVLTMADHHAIYKQCLREIADSLDMSVTFMAKYAADQAGSSCHVHVSLWSGGANAFAGSRRIGPVEASDVFRWFLGGWIEHVPELMVLYASTVNAYKRYQPGSWAPTGLAWSGDNRTAGFRIVGDDQSLRIENRIPGADCNPYLVYTAALASGLDGVARQIEPPESYTGDAYAAKDVAHVPRTLAEAVELFDRSGFARQALGDDVVDHYAHFFRTEQAAYDRAVTDWERQRYFERM